MTTLIKFEDPELPALTVIAQEQYEECLWAIEKALDKQLDGGLLLTDLKWKSAQRYMRGADSIATERAVLALDQPQMDAVSDKKHPLASGN